jgi:predicted XRE-type DNA-binding protein
MKIVTSADSLNAVESMVRMLEEREWAEHAGVCPLTQRLETCITTMHNEIATKNVECENYERDNAQAVDFLGGQRDGLGDLCSQYRDEIWRLRDGINSLLNGITLGSTETTLVALRDLATSNIQCCPPLPGQVVVGMNVRSFVERYANAFDALIDDPAEREDLKERSRIMRVIRNAVTERYGKKEYTWLTNTLGFSQTIWQALYEGHIDELELDTLTRIAELLGIPTDESLKPIHPHELIEDENDLARIAHEWARAIVVHARAMNQTGVAERYMVPQFRERFKITTEEWLILEVMHRQSWATDALSISRLIQIANDGGVNLPVIDLDK